MARLTKVDEAMEINQSFGGTTKLKFIFNRSVRNNTDKKKYDWLQYHHLGW